MFSVRKGELLNISDEFGNMSVLLEQQYSEIQSIIARLRELSDMENVIYTLRREGEKIARMRAVMKQMDTVLADSAELYGDADRRAAEEYDNSGLHIPIPKIRRVDMSRWKKVLKDVPFGF